MGEQFTQRIAELTAHNEAITIEFRALTEQAELIQQRLAALDRQFFGNSERLAEVQEWLAQLTAEDDGNDPGRDGAE